MTVRARRLQHFMAFVASVGVAIGAAAPVTADPDNPYSGLSCSCPSQGARHRLDVPEITEGIVEGLAGLRAPQPETKRRFAGRSTAGRPARTAQASKRSRCAKR
ncbi:hypothetical protein Mkiyose1665_55200 [Mycobacterium kiyosense]|jgi:hypothetical protein|uniref:Uncharacterized protein n=1 Tax=Mycobacterium kiyosense TaxID=2871094 RepID=A0AA37V7G0_9MYCO|nr:hypothetical protein SRL2020028_50900 [Mycobacterium kiyosense]GLB92263.1 hypothetical protein SRL2020130_50800 [Mycobacterium kiyosense]GLB98571.1 hypothetical protein SRL2020226_53470 [Mycobacterium kiyosense]GLC04786.1 hypothetical protein SRL2020400_53770 [Mycobacterium kiyosense]GLC10218.1 hypothetical protein SRL2020411_48640 [Mycobacterium kiyosense]